MCYPRAGGEEKEGSQLLGRGELTEEAWGVIASLLPARGRRGGRWRDHRTVINGIRWKLRTGAPWRDLPERYGPWQTCADRLYRRRRDGTWDRILAHVQTKSDAVGEVVWEVSVDSTTARAHQHASGARRRPSRADTKGGVQHPVDEGLGRSRGGLTTKFHLSCDGKGRPLSVVNTLGQRHASTQLAAVLDGIRIPRPGGQGRPRTRPHRVIADKGDSYPHCRRLLRQRHIPHNIPERRDQRARRATRPGRSPAFDRAIYARRNVVERCISRLKQWHGLATRYEKRAINYRAMVVLASMVIWLDA